MSRIKKIVSIFVCLFITSAWSTSKPEVFLIGDSISVQYFPFLKTYMADFAVLERKTDNGQAEKNLDVPAGANGGDSRMVLEYLRTKLKNPAFKLDYLLLNCGLHDIKRDPNTDAFQVTEDNYRRNLTEIVLMLRKQKIKPVWIRTTWVVDSIHHAKLSTFKRYEADVLKYNAIADEVFRKNKIPSIDLYSFTKQLGTETFIDHVHYDEPTRTLQAAYIAGFVQKILKSY
jgi:hypothetical protein